MWEYREEYINNQYLNEALNFYGKEGWVVYQIKKDEIERESYGDRWTEIIHYVYMKKRVE